MSMFGDLSCIYIIYVIIFITNESIPIIFLYVQVRLIYYIQYYNIYSTCNNNQIKKLSKINMK